ncbi:MAG: LytTR family DNA-binding domain-containing protein [Anaerovoracaceae bacterium]|jgi:two-component system response regulator LytT
MNVKLELSAAYSPPYAVIYTDTVTDRIRRVMDLIGSGAAAEEAPVVAQHEDRIMVLKPEEIYLIRVEDKHTVVYTEKEHYFSRKRLYELQQQLGKGFMQISRQCIVNLSYIRSVETGFGGSLRLNLDNGLGDYVSRTYLPPFRRYLGL